MPVFQDTSDSCKGSEELEVYSQDFGVRCRETGKFETLWQQPNLMDKNEEDEGINI